MLNGRSQTWLASESGVGQSTISRLIRGKAKPNPKTLEALAKALGANPLHFMKLAGLPVTSDQLDPEIAYIARRLGSLPSHLQESAISALGAQIDAFYDVWEREKQFLVVPDYEKLRRRVRNGD
ncbi:MAG: helix-turn-helix domain-containing protein [Ardenticatenaceae bacterium]